MESCNMINAKHKIFRPNINKITEENIQIAVNNTGFYSYLNTITEEEAKSAKNDILSDFKIKNLYLKEEPSNIEINHKSTSYKIELNKADWDKVFEADNKPIDYESIRKFKDSIKHFYE